MLGILLVLMTDAWSFGEVWIWLSIVLYVGGIALAHGVLQPNVRRMIAIMEGMVATRPDDRAAGPPPEVAELEERGKLVGAVGATLNVLLVVLLYLMVFKPGA